MTSKFAIKCGNFAVMVDLRALTLGGQADTSWFTHELKEEVSVLIRDAVDLRVKRFLESRQQRGPSKHRKEAQPSSEPLYIKGRAFHLAAYFIRRHVNLRCVMKRHCRELRMFPERFVVCVSIPEDTAAHDGNVNLSVNRAEQSQSKYFSGRGETLEPLSSSGITRRTALQKIVSRAKTKAEPGQPNLLNQRQGGTEAPGLPNPSAGEVTAGPGGSLPSHSHALDAGPRLQDVVSQEADRVVGGTLAPQSGPETTEGAKSTGLVQAANPQQHHKTDPPPQAAGSGKRSKKRRSKPLGGPLQQEAKRACLGAAPASPREVPLADSSGQISPPISKLGPHLPPSSPQPPASTIPPPAIKHAEGTTAVELLPNGKLPHTNGCTEPADRSRLATSPRGRSVKSVSSGSSISSRSTAKEEELKGRGTAARPSRLRRPKKS
ncbi:protein SLX4IP isoform X2 [Denticeps clupeoides]|uniref:protein SLX4IP isoform X2 n=1 Tax=Denticeps clupeoides TaxID=299321 RepID=UPI0010A4D685|nr:protein SLX4IP isoform X2 [Denticeps clupeoides]XP_028845899.1 protein SLX4IP isoform X2 [Denticeps clupeoides]